MTAKINLFRPSAFAERAELFYSDIIGRTKSVVFSTQEQNPSFVDDSLFIPIELTPSKSFNGQKVHIAKSALLGGEEFMDFRSKLSQKAQEVKEGGLTFFAKIEINLLLLDKNGRKVLCQEDFSPILSNEVTKFIDVIFDECKKCNLTLLSARAKEVGYVTFSSEGEALTLADFILLFKVIAKRVAQKFGYLCTFMPKPFLEEKGEGLGIELEIKGERRESFLEGVILHSGELLSLCSANVNSFARFLPAEKYRYICYGKENALFCEVPKRDCLCVKFDFCDLLQNPYIIFCAILEAGLLGIENGLSLREVIFEVTPSVKKELDRLPSSLLEGLELGEASGFLRRVLGESASRIYYELKKKEAESIKENAGEEEHRKRYFDFF